MVLWDLFCSLEFIIVLFIWQPCDLFLEGSRVNFTWPCWVWIPLSSLSCCLISSLPHLACISCLWFLLWSVLISIWMPLTCFVRTEAGKKVEIESRACVEVNLFFCVSIRSNLPEEDIFASFSCLWNRPLGLTNTSQVGIKTQFGQGSCYVAIRNASKDPGGIRKSWAVVISKTPVPVSIPLLEQKKGRTEECWSLFSLLFRAGWIHRAYLSLFWKVTSRWSNLRPHPHHSLFSQLRRSLNRGAF